MLTPAEFDRAIDQRARVLKAEALTPQHAAAEAAMDGEDEAERRRRRVQHEADPYPDVPEVAAVDLDKTFRQAFDNDLSGPPPMGPVSPEMFRRGPITRDRYAYGPGYQASGLPAAPPTDTVTPGMVTRPLFTDGPWSTPPGGFSC